MTVKAEHKEAVGERQGRLNKYQVFVSFNMRSGGGNLPCGQSPGSSALFD
jgi:hypothetical protein